MALGGGGEAQTQGDAVRECGAGVLGPQVVDLVGDKQVVDVAGGNPRAAQGFVSLGRECCWGGRTELARQRLGYRASLLATLNPGYRPRFGRWRWW
jgi:hypothetical protein